MVSAIVAALAAAWYYFGEELGLPMPMPEASTTSGPVAEAPPPPPAPVDEPETPSANPPPADAISGTASVVDADTLDIRSERIRLVGVDAPESGQKCLDAGNKLVRCGTIAANALDAWINRNPVTCVSEGKDRYQRVLGKCTVRGESVQDWLVRHGHAVAYRAYSTEFVPAEEAAHSAKAGMWAGDFVMPWDWRKGQRLPIEKPVTAN